MTLELYDGHDYADADAYDEHGQIIPLPRRFRDADIARAEEIRKQIIDIDGLREMPAPEPIVSGLGGKGGTLFADSLAWLYGKPGHGKSFVTVDLACSVATGKRWHGRDVQQGPVLYIVAEGASGMSRRVDAWSTHHGVSPIDLFFLPHAVQFGESIDVGALRIIASEMRPRLIVVDTQARTTVGLEENSSKEMGLFIAAIDKVREDSGACVLVNHHIGRAGEHMRGSTAIDGAATTTIRCEKDGLFVRLDFTKQKDVEEGPPMAFRLVESADSAVLDQTDALRTDHPLTPNQKKVLDALATFGKDEGDSISGLQKKSGVGESSFYEALKALIGKGLVVKQGRRYVLPESEEGAA